MAGAGPIVSAPLDGEAGGSGAAGGGIGAVSTHPLPPPRTPAPQGPARKQRAGGGRGSGPPGTAPPAGRLPRPPGRGLEAVGGVINADWTHIEIEKPVGRDSNNEAYSRKAGATTCKLMG